MLTTAELETTLLKSLPAKLHLEMSDLLSTMVMREAWQLSDNACHCIAYCFLASLEGPAPAETSPIDHDARARRETLAGECFMMTTMLQSVMVAFVYTVGYVVCRE